MTYLDITSFYWPCQRIRLFFTEKIYLIVKSLRSNSKLFPFSILINGYPLWHFEFKKGRHFLIKKNLVG